MAIIQQFYDAWDSQDIETVDKLTHESFIAWSHSGNKGFTKEEWMSWISPDFPKAEKLRIIFENDEIAVTHQFMSFKNGKEAVLCAWSIKEDKIIRCETDPSPISSYPIVKPFKRLLTNSTSVVTLRHANSLNPFIAKIG